MQTYIQKIREIAVDLLKEEKVEEIIGFRQGTIPLISEPCRVKDAAEVNSLVWDSYCSANLAAYLSDIKGTVGIVAKGCDSRNIVNHLIENRIKRDQLVIIGVPCKGMVDRRKMETAYGGDVLDVEEEDGTIRVSGTNGSMEFIRSDMLQHNCQTCCHHNPAIHDILVADEVPEPEAADAFEQVKEIESMSVPDRQSYFEDLYSACVRCYACRNACPLCYCPTCFVDESHPQWVGKSDDPTDTMTFHLLRAFHCAGRCTDCGACERACPQDIPVRILTRKLSKDCLDLYGWEAGLTLESRPPLDTFKTDDPEGFIK